MTLMSSSTSWVTASVLIITLSIIPSDVGSSNSGNSVGSGGGSSNPASFIYSSGRGKSNKKDLSSFGASSVGVGGQQVAAASSSSLLSTAYVEPRGDYSGGGGYGGSGGGYGGGGSPAVFHYTHIPQGGGGGIGGGGGGGWGGPPVYYQEEGGFEGVDKGLIGLLGLSGLGGLKGLLGLAALAKLLLPLLLLLIPLLLPLLLAKAALLFALLLLIPIPVITPGRSLTKDGKEVTGKAYFQETLSEIMTKLPENLSHIIAKIKDSDFFKGKESMKVNTKKSIISREKSAIKSELKDNLVKNTS